MGVQGDAEWREQWALVNTPLGERRSGRTRYAAAQFFHRNGAMTAEALEIYRLCERSDNQDPLVLIRAHNVGKGWLERFGDQ